MIFKPYPKYKSCTIQWLNEIPQSWKQVRVEQYLIKKDENIGDLWSSTQLLSLTQKGIIEKDINDGKGKTHSDYSTYQAIDIGDLVFCLFDIDETPRTVGLSTKKGMITSAYTAFKSKENINTQYLYYFFESLDDAKALKPYYKGLRKTVRPPEFLKIHVPFPPKVEQVPISQFLDTETARIDKLISKQEKLIKLLEEQRKSIISYAVTKGLNPNAPMKDSGVEWLGEVPEGWTMLKLNFVVNQIADIDHYMPNSSSQGFPYLMTGDLQEKVSLIDFLKCKQVSTEDYLHLSKKIKSSKGDLILARYATIGTVSYVDIDANFLVSYSCVTIKPKLSKIIGMYLYYYIKSNAFYNFCKNYINTNTQGNLGIDNLKKINVLLPSIFEQEKIINFLDSENIKFDNLISKQEKLIEKLKEYRSSIISHAVTGKIDVREWVA